MKYLTIPGLSSSGSNHWQTLWEQKFPDSFIRIEQKNWITPVKIDWVKKVNAYISYQEEPVVLIAHSLGCITIAHWASEFNSTTIAGALLVAPADVEKSTKKELKCFAPIPKEKLNFPSIVVASNNDPFAELERTKEWAQNWGSRHVCVGNIGHINANSAIGEWREGLELLREICGSKLAV